MTARWDLWAVVVVLVAGAGLPRAAEQLGAGPAFGLWAALLAAAAAALIVLRPAAVRARFPAPGLRDVAGGLLAGVGLFVVAGVGYAVSEGLGLQPPAAAELVPRQGLALLWALIAVTAAAFLEEYVFRGELLDWLGSRISRPTAALLSALVFAVYHLSAFQWLPTFLLGLGLALLTQKARRVTPALFAHATFNVAGILIGALVQQAR